MSARIALAALCAVLVAHVTATEPDLAAFRQYTLSLHKGMTGAQLTITKGPFYVREGQCTGLLDDLLKCPVLTVPKAVHVSVEDVMGYARVIIADDLRSASVVRSSPCRGEARVLLKLACLP